MYLVFLFFFQLSFCLTLLHIASGIPDSARQQKQGNSDSEEGFCLFVLFLFLFVLSTGV